jgi:anti-sigma-K factor RskA
VTTLRDPSADDLAAEYVLGELSRDEAENFERRLANDPELAAEVRRLRTTLGLLPLATVTEPPAHLRARVLAAGEGSAPARATRGRVV